MNVKLTNVKHTSKVNGSFIILSGWKLISWNKRITH